MRGDLCAAIQGAADPLIEGALEFDGRLVNGDAADEALENLADVERIVINGDGSDVSKVIFDAAELDLRRLLDAGF